MSRETHYIFIETVAYFFMIYVQVFPASQTGGALCEK